MATGEVRGVFSMSEPGLGSDVAAITSRGVPDGDSHLLTGQKMWLTNGSSANLVAILCRTGQGNPEGTAPHRSMTTFLVEKEPGYGEVRPGLTIPGKIDKTGCKGRDTTELLMDGLRIPADRVLGGAEDGAGRGFYRMMDGVEVGRVNVAARGCGKEYEIERLYREAPMLLIGEGTAEIQKMIIGRRLLDEYRIAG
jgi:hypothetical protein